MRVIPRKKEDEDGYESASTEKEINYSYSTLPAYFIVKAEILIEYYTALDLYRQLWVKRVAETPDEYAELRFAGHVIALFLKLSPGYIKYPQKKDLDSLNNYIRTPKVLPIMEAIKYFLILQTLIENMGITRIDVKQLPMSDSWREGVEE